MKQTCILVLGMHRSGTSALTGLLSMCDVYLGSELLEAKNDNKKGFYENKKIVSINENILTNLNSHWHDVFFRPSDLENLDNNLIDELKCIIETEFKNRKVFAIKDPRLAFLFPVYEKILQDMSIEMKIIIPYRNPIEVAHSLFKRDKFSTKKSLFLWMQSILFSEYFSKSYHRIFIPFDDLILETAEIVKKLDAAFSLNLYQKYLDNKNKIELFLEPSLKHYNISMDEANKKVPWMIQDILQGIINDSKQLDKVRNEVFSYQELFYHEEIITELQQLRPVKKEIKAEKTIDTLVEALKKSTDSKAQVLQLLNERQKALEIAEETIKTLEAECIKNRKALKQKDRIMDQTSYLLKKMNVTLQSVRNTIDRQEIKLAERQKKINSLQQEIAKVYSSNSWKITRSFRNIWRLLK